MNGLHLLDCFEPEAVKLERVRYFQRQLLTADDMETDQEYFRQKLRRHNRFMHGWGVVCGLEVLVAPTQEQPWRIEIAPGYVLFPYGDEGFVAKSTFLNLADCGEGAETDPCDPETWQKRGTGVGRELFIAIKYAQCKARPVKAMPPGCGCDELPCEYSRIRDSYQVECLSALPPSHLEPPPEHTLCDYVQGRALPPCPPCPADPWVVLAKVTLPASPSTNLEKNDIDNFVRRQIFSTAILQQQLIECCCEKGEPLPLAPPVVTEVDPPHDTAFDESNAPSSIVLTFSQNLQLGTVDESTIFIRKQPAGGPNEPVLGNVTYNEQTRTATFTPSGPLLSGIYTVTALGDGDPHIKGLSGMRLDGNKDTFEGGNFKSNFEIRPALY